MKLAAVQFRGNRHDKPGSLRRLVGFAEQAAVGSDLVVLPEMAVTQYHYDSKAAVARIAEPPRGSTFAAMAPVAREHHCWLVVGFVEQAADRFFNAALVIDPAGELAFTYRKTTLYDLDWPWATPGDSGFRRFDGDAGSFTVGICMDMNDDDFTEHCASCGADVVAFPTNWVEEFGRVWNYWRRRLHPDAVLVAANTYGFDTCTWFSGRSVILDRGQPRAWAEWLGDAVIRADVAL